MRSFDVVILWSFRLNCVENCDLFSLFGIFLWDVTHLGHHIECLVLTSNQCFIAICIIWVKNTRVVRNSSEKGRLSKSQILSWFTEVSLSSRFYTVTTTTIRRLVEVHGNNLFLWVHLLNFESENHFLNLTWKTGYGTVFSFIGEVNLFNELLGKCRTTLDTLTSKSWEGSTDNSGKVDTWVVVEVSILDCNGSLAHISCNVVTLNHETIVAITLIFPKDIAVTVEIGINRFRNRHLIETDGFEILLVIKEETTDCDHGK